jgi:hypothetical protein
MALVCACAVAQPVMDSVATSHAVLNILAVCMIIVRFFG